MELRKDPITKSWVVVGPSDQARVPDDPCPLCPVNLSRTKALLYFPDAQKWQVCVIPHPRPLYHIEGDAGTLGGGNLRSHGAGGRARDRHRNAGS